jgi:hypothetical protein
MYQGKLNHICKQKRCKVAQRMKVQLLKYYVGYTYLFIRFLLVLLILQHTVRQLYSLTLICKGGNLMGGWVLVVRK